MRQGPTGTSVRNVTEALYAAFNRLGYEVRSLAHPREAMHTEALVGWCVPAHCKSSEAGLVCSVDPVDGWGWFPDHVQRKNVMCDIQFGLSHASCGQMRSLGVTNVQWLPMGAFTPTPCYEEHPLSAAMREHPDDFWFLTIGAMQPRKRYPDLLQAFCEEFADTPGVRLGVKATGTNKGWGVPYGQKTRALAGTMMDRIVYDDSDYSGEGIAWLYQNAHAYVTASAVEGWGLPPLEAMSQGCLVVATDASGHRDFVTEDNAVLIPTTPEPMGQAGVDRHCLPQIASRLTWDRASIPDIRAAMRQAYELSTTDRQAKMVAGHRTARCFSWEYAASVLVEAIQEQGFRLKRTRQNAWPIGADTHVVILIPSLNYRALLKRCLETLGATQSVSFSVIVLDDGSTDGTMAMIDELRPSLPYQVIAMRHERRRGLPVSRDALIKLAMGAEPHATHYCFLDADIEATDPDWLLKLASLHFEGISAPKIVFPDGRIWAAGGAAIDPRTMVLTLNGYGANDAPQFNNPVAVEHVGGACMFMRAELWKRGHIKVDHGYPMRYCDDTDLCLQATRATGEHCWYWPQATLVHHCNTLRPRTLVEQVEHETSSRTARDRFRAKWFPPKPVRRASDSQVGSGASGIPLVSVVMPLYNYEDLVTRAIHSVQAQTLVDWELIVVDDGSRDDGAAVVADLAAEDRRIRLLRHDANKGLPVARNTGFGAARGRYVALLDADDEYLPRALDTLATWMQEHPETVLAYGNFQWDSGERGTAEPYKWETLTERDYIPCQAVMLDRIALRCIGGNDPAMEHAEDWDHWLRVAAATDGAVDYIGPDPLYVLHRHDRQRTRDVAALRLYDDIVGKRAASYAAVRNGVVRVAHVSYALRPHGAQEVLRQIVEGASPHVEHTIYVPKVIGSDLEATLDGACHGVLPLSAGIGRAFAADVLHIHYPCEPLMKWLETKPRTPIVVTRHGLEPLPDQLVARDGIAVTEVWPWDRADGSVCIPNGVDYGLLLDYPLERTRGTTVVGMGRFDDAKRAGLFAEVCWALHRTWPGQYRFIYVGGDMDDPHAEEVLRLFGGLIAHVPACDHTVAIGALNMGDVFVLTSASETRPLCLMEARGMGLSCIATEVGGTGSIEGVETLLVSAGCAEWAEAVERAAGRGPYDRPPENDGRLMVKRYEWLYRGLAMRGGVT